jgi:phenylalanyl-tRNA synthetase beta chain
MKFTLSWLRDHLDTTASLAALTEKLSAMGLDVESVDDPGARLKPFTIARVIDAKPHPNADRLRVCTLDTGAGVVEVVCGAPNARAGMLGVFAPVGSHIPGTNLTLDRRPVRGVVSNGMLLSERELGISEEHEGVVELGEEFRAQVGKGYAEAAGLADAVIEVKLTPNRPDCTGVRGIARDLAAAGLGTLNREEIPSGVEGDFACPIDILLEFPAAARSACPCFAGRYIAGVSNGASPAAIQRRLRAVGLRPINALVDVTNYISLDRGRPLHVYDADKLHGAIRARLGRTGERFLGLDGRVHEVDESMCVIADAEAVLGLGGILGGADTGCTETTRNAFIECAYFDPLRTAATGRKTAIESDARYRFERGVDPAFILPGLDLATAMMLGAAGGTPSKARVAGAPPLQKRTIAFAFADVAKLTGLELSEAEIGATLSALGFALEGSRQRAMVTVPSWRPDIGGAVDLVEEVVRIKGFDRIPSAPLQRDAGVARPTLTEPQRRARRARRALAARGLTEAVTWSFIPRAAAEAFGGGQEQLQIANPISSEMTTMRPSLLPGLLAAVKRNSNRGFADVALFEVGQAYRSDEPDGQFTAASGVRAGAALLAGSGRHWTGTMAHADLFDAKADVAGLFAELGLDAAKAQLARTAPPWFHPGRSASLRLSPKTVIAHFGVVHPDVLLQLGLDGPVAAFEVFLDALPPQRRKGAQRAPLQAESLLPVRRDFAFVLDAGVAAGDVVRAALGADRSLIAAVNVFDLFEGRTLGAGKKSLALEVTLQPAERTLTDADIDGVSAKIIAAVGKATGGEIRR